MQSMNFFSCDKILRWMKVVIFRPTFILFMSSGHGMKITFFHPAGVLDSVIRRRDQRMTFSRSQVQSDWQYIFFNSRPVLDPITNYWPQETYT